MYYCIRTLIWIPDYRKLCVLRRKWLNFCWNLSHTGCYNKPSDQSFFSRENDYPLLSIDKVLSSCHRNSICHKGRIVSWTFELSVSSCHNNTNRVVLSPNGSCSLHVNDIYMFTYIRVSHMHAVRSV